MKQVLLLAAGAAVATGIMAGAQHQADGAARAAVARFESALPAANDLAYASVSADLFAGGATLNDVTFRLAGGATLNAETVEVGNVVRDGDGETIDRLVAHGVSLAPADPTSEVRVMIGRLEARDLRADPVAAILDGGPMDWPEFSGISLADMALADAGKVTLTVASGEIGRSRFGYVGHSVLSGLRLPIEPQPGNPDRLDELSVARFEISELNLAPMLALPAEPSKEQIARAIAATGDSSMRISDIVGARDGQALMTIDAITSETDNGETGISRQRIRVGDIVFAGDMFVNDRGENVLQELGYDDLRGELTLELALDGPAGKLDVSTIRLALQDAASLDLGLNIGEVPLRFISIGYEPTEEELARLTFEGLNITLTDNSLLHRIATMVGGRQGIDGTIYRQAQAASLRQTAAGAEIPEVRDFFNELADFVEEPGTLSLAAAPVQPIPVVALVATAMTDPFAAMSLLEIEVASR